MNYIFLIAVIGVIAVVLGIAMFTNFELDDKHYDRLKWLVERWHYITVFIGLIVKTFNIAYGVETVTIVAGFGALIAGLLGISTSNWKLDQPQITFNDESLTEMMDVSAEEGSNEGWNHLSK